MPSQPNQRTRQASFIGRLAAGARGVSSRVDGVLSRGQLGPSREAERRDFNPARRV